MRVAAFQFDVRRGEVAHNLGEVERGLRGASGDGAELVVLPEMWATSFVAGEGQDWLAQTEDALGRVAQLGKALGIVVAGSAFGAPRAGRVRNRLTVVNAGREVLAYDKVHLFSPTAEHLAFGCGEAAPKTVDCRGIRLSGVVCYDLRFASLLRAPLLDEVELLVVSAQWPETRSLHWHALVVGRAVEMQTFVVACNRTGCDQVGRRKMELVFPGHSLIVSPHGRVLAQAEGQTGWIVADVDPGEARELRRRVPIRADEWDGPITR